jgi:acyl-CoA thioesterase
MDFSNGDMNRLNDNTLYHTMGIRVEAAHGGEAYAVLRPKSEVCWPFSGQPHGGVLFTLMDTAMAWAVLTGLDEGQNCATIDLAIQYPRPARGEAFSCRARIVQRGSLIVYTRGDILDEGDHLVATGQACFRIINAPL